MFYVLYKSDAFEILYLCSVLKKGRKKTLIWSHFQVTTAPVQCLFLQSHIRWCRTWTWAPCPEPSYSYSTSYTVGARDDTEPYSPTSSWRHWRTFFKKPNTLMLAHENNWHEKCTYVKKKLRWVTVFFFFF